MRLFFWRTHPDDVAAVEKAERGLAEVHERWPEVKEQAARVRKHGERNHFADMIRAAMGVQK